MRNPFCLSKSDNLPPARGSTHEPNVGGPFPLGADPMISDLWLGVNEQEINAMKRARRALLTGALIALVALGAWLLGDRIYTAMHEHNAARIAAKK